jgi:uncharacterized protein
VEQISVAWRGVDDPSRLDNAVVRLSDAGMRAHGVSITSGYSLAWSLDAEDRWRTRALEVSVRGEGWSRWLALSRSPAGVWSTRAGARGNAALPPPGLADPDELDAALDCDLGLCPATNTMPVRRCGLQAAAVSVEAPFVMALVEVPSLRVVRSEQVYRSAGPAAVEFRSGDFRAELSLDEHGLVVDYPELAFRVR